MSPIKGPSVIAQGYGEARLGDRMSKSEGALINVFKEKCYCLLFDMWLKHFKGWAEIQGIIFHAKIEISDTKRVEKNPIYIFSTLG